MILRIKSPKTYNHLWQLKFLAVPALLFTDCYAVEVGSVHDATLFCRSDLFGRIEDDS